jgi:uncharacterized repeat protein (TIGR03803 family)
MPSKAPRSIPLFRPIFLAGVTTLLILLAALPIAAQTSVPPSAVEAARMPQFAKRLAHSARPASPPNSARSRRGAPPDGIIYDNGPINGTTDAWAINFGFVVADSFPSDGGQISGLSFGAWLFPGDVLQSVELTITDSPLGGTTYFDGIINLTQDGCVGNQYGFNVCTASASFTGPTLNSGTYWVNLQNAQVNTGDPAYWDENSGPSLAEQNSVGTIPSEAFSILGGCPPEQGPRAESKAIRVPPSPTQSYRVIYNFTGGADGGAPSTGLVTDAAGNLYGTASYGGASGGGTVFKLTPGDSGWRFNRLYSFTGANGSEPNSTLVRGPDGRLYGTTYGGGLGNGVLFGLSPAGNILPTPFTNWMESLLYDFTGGNDGASPGGSLALDDSGNIYGTAVTGGANGGGTLYQFTNGGIQVLHSFPAFPGDGIGPTGVVRNADGLYGITESGSDNYSYDGTTYTTVGGYRVLQELSGGQARWDSLAADQGGNLYRTESEIDYNCEEENGVVNVEQFVPPGSTTWLTGFEMRDTELKSWVSTDAAGSVYGTVDNLGGYGNVYKLTCCWNYTDLHDFTGGPSDGQQPVAAPVVDAQGNIYGTTAGGGLYGQGVVWEISP